MNALTRFTMLAFALGLYVGCSPVKFSLDNSKCTDMAGSCVVENGKYSFNYSVTAGAGKVDILIVDDNSASMSFEQARLAPRFANFIDNLDARSVDYRIAITTTDVSGGPYPQGGSLIPFSDGSAYITPKTANRTSLFNSNIQRPETLACEKSIADWVRTYGVAPSSFNNICPSGDERGVYAANRVVINNPSTFIRNDAHLAIIFLSDEDERSGFYGNQSAYALADLDQPATLINNVKTVLGDSKYNSLSVHAIVVKDGSCLSQQNSQALGNPAVPATVGMMTGSIGAIYLSFTDDPTYGIRSFPGNSNAVPWGVAADICSSDYTGQLGAIQTELQSKITDVMLNCTNPTDLVVTANGAAVAYTIDGQTLKFNTAIAPGTTVNLTYKCDTL